MSYINLPPDQFNRNIPLVMVSSQTSLHNKMQKYAWKDDIQLFYCVQRFEPSSRSAVTSSDSANPNIQDIVSSTTACDL